MDHIECGQSTRQGVTQSFYTFHGIFTAYSHDRNAIVKTRARRMYPLSNYSGRPHACPYPFAQKAKMPTINKRFFSPFFRSDCAPGDRSQQRERVCWAVVDRVGFAGGRCVLCSKTRSNDLQRPCYFSSSMIYCTCLPISSGPLLFLVKAICQRSVTDRFDQE